MLQLSSRLPEEFAILHSGGCVEHGQFLPGGFPQIRWGILWLFPVSQNPSCFVREGLNHEESLINVVNNVKH